MDEETLIEALKGKTPEEIASLLKEQEPSPALDLEEVKTVAKAKGLAEPDGDVVKKFMPATVKSLASDSIETKGAKGKKELKDYHPTPEELKQINEFSNIDMKAEEVLVFTLHSADDVVDRSSDQFTTKALKEMASLSKDKPYLKDHSWGTASVVGKIFDASVSKGRLMQKVYVSIRAKNLDMIDGMLDGTLNKVSVGFAMGAEDYSCSSCSKSLYSMDCPHYPGSKDEKGNITVGIIKGVKDYYEISNVTVPCQPGAGIRRDNQKSLEVLASEASEGQVDRISNDKSLGDSPLKEEVKPVVEVEVPAAEVEVPAEAPVEPAAAPEEAPVVEDVKALIKEAVTEATNELKALIADLKATLSQKEAEESVQEESVEDAVRKALAAQAPAPQPAKVDMTKDGWAAQLFRTSFSNQ